MPIKLGHPVHTVKPPISRPGDCFVKNPGMGEATVGVGIIERRAELNKVIHYIFAVIIPLTIVDLR